MLAPRLETVFLGGGTPTFTAPAALERLLAGLPDADEVTVEANPETVTPELAAASVTKPCQSRVARRAELPAAAARRCWSAARSPTTSGAPCTFFVMPDLTTSRSISSTGSRARAPPTSTRDLAEALALEPEHLSCYELEAKPGTRFTHAHGAELERQAESMETYFERVVATLTGAGYRWYETANFCRRSSGGGRDLRARHNLALLARTGLPRPRDRRGLDNRRPAAAERAAARRVPRGARGGRRAAARARAARRRHPPRASGVHARAPARRAARRSPGWRTRSTATRSTRLERLGLARAPGRGRRTRRWRSPSGADSWAAASPPSCWRSICLHRRDRTRAPTSAQRQREILIRVVEEYVATGQPVGSKHLVERAGMHVSSSTVRNELAELERLGLLTHPHTSAGRVPTDRGYRYYVDRLLERQEPRPATLPARPGRGAQRGRVGAPGDDGDALAGDAADRARLGAAARDRDRPPRRGADAPAADRDGGRDHVDRRRDEARLRVRRAGRPRARELGRPVPERAARRALAREQHSSGGGWPTRACRPRARVPRGARAPPSPRPRAASSASTSAARPACSTRCADEELGSYRSLIDLLERRRALLDLLAEALDPRRPFVRVGDELANPALRDLALVGAAYGIANRTLGAVSLIGPSRMDYDKAIRTVRSAASELSRFAEVIYGEN